MRILKIILLACLLLNAVFIRAQDKCKILLTNTSEGSVMVKWYSDNVYFDQNIFVYRQESGSNDWINVTTHAFAKGVPISDIVLKRDKVLSVLQDKALITKSSELDGMTKLFLMIKSIQYPEFAEFLGIQFIDLNIAKGNKYRYLISYSSSDTKKPIATSEWIVAGDYVPAEAPNEIELTQEKTSLYFSWLPDENNFMGVYIYRSIKGEKATRITSVPVLAGLDENGKYLDVFFTDDSLSVGTEYEYTLRSIDYFGRESNESDKFTIKIRDMEPPPSPDKVNVDVQGKKVHLYWENENVLDLAGYKVYRTEVNDTIYKCITAMLIPKETQVYIDSVAEIGVYNYKVATVDQAENEALSFAYPADIIDIFPPSVPQSVVAVSDIGKIILSWQACTDYDIMGYYIFRSIAPGAAFLLVNADPVVETTFTDKLPSIARNQFAYKVVAVDLAYNRSGFSESAAARMPDVAAPEKPIIKNIRQEKNSLIIEWYPNSEPDLTGYHVYRYDEKSGVEQAKRLNNKIIPQIPIFTDPLPQPGVKYYYYVIACDSTNNLSEASDVKSAKIEAEISDLKIIKSMTVKYNKKTRNVDVSWKTSNDDKSTSYIVYRKNDESENFKPVSGKIKKTEFTDNINKSETVFYYRIAAFKPDNSIQYSKTETITIKN